ncbi:7739_t:CDS:1, partial [Acaulospora morrowiae]
MFGAFSKKAKKNNDSRNISENDELTSKPNFTVAINNRATLAFFASKALQKAKLITPKKPNNKSESQKYPPPVYESPPNTATTLAPQPPNRKSKSLNEESINPRHGHERRPSEPSRFDGRVLRNYNTDANVNDTRRADGSSSSARKNQNKPIERSSSISGVPIIKEGYLNKRVDFDVKSVSTSRSWKVYHVELKGSKLYFYKPPSEAVLKTFFPNNKGLNTVKDMASTLSPLNERGMYLSPSSFESSASKLIFEGVSTNSEIEMNSPLISKYHYGEVCYEVDRTSAMRFKKHVCLLIFEDSVVICKRKWVRHTAPNLRPIIGVMGFGGNHSPTNVAPSNDASGQDWDTKSIGSIRGIPDNDGSTTNKGKGYYTRWKLDALYSIHNIDVIPDPNLPTSHSPYIAPSSQPSLFTASKRNDDTSSLRSVSSSVSAIANVSSSSGAILYLNIIDGHEKD